MGKYKKLTSIEILLILAIIAVLAVWLFPRFLKLIKSNSDIVGMVRPCMEEISAAGFPPKSKLHDLISPLIVDIKQI